jgi:hypothetical protein
MTVNTEIRSGNKPPVQPETEDGWLLCPDCGSQARGRLGGSPSWPDSGTTVMACTNPGCWWEYNWINRETWHGYNKDVELPRYVGHIRPWVRRGEGGR